MAISLKEVEAMVDALETSDQVRLLRYLVPRLADAVLSAEIPAGSADSAWQDFRRIGERLAAAPSGQSITQSIGDMRR